MRKSIRAVFFVLIIVSFVFTIVLSLFSTLWRQKFHTENANKLVNISNGWGINESATFSDEGIITIRRVIGSGDIAELFPNITKEQFEKAFILQPVSISPSLFFTTKNQIVLVYVNWGEGDKLIYTYGCDGTFLTGNEGGCAVHSVPVPFQGRESVIVSIQLAPAFSSVNFNFDRWYYKTCGIKVPKVYMGWDSQVLQQMVNTTWFQWVPVFLLALVSITILLYFAVFYFMEKKFLSRYLFLGIFSLGTALTLYFESTVGFYTFSNSFIPYFITTFLIAFEPFFTMHFLHLRNSVKENSIYNKVFKYGSLLNSVLVCAFAFVRFVPFTCIRFYVCSFVVASAIFKFSVVLHEIISEKGHADYYDVITLLICCCIIVDAILFILIPGKHDLLMVTRWGSLLFFASYGVNATREFFAGELAVARSEILRKTLDYDFVTGLPRGTNAWRDRRLIWGQKFGFILLGIAGFKEINRKFGVTECENVLKMLSQALKNIYPLENIFQLTGSKFGVYVPLDKMENVEDEMKLIKDAEDDYNSLKLGYKIHIEFVYSVMDLEKDVNLEGLYARLLPELLDKMFTNAEIKTEQLNLF